MNGNTGNLNERTKKDFLIYANSVIKSRAIPSVEDNLKPIHRKILYTLYEDKLTPDKSTKKWQQRREEFWLILHTETPLFMALWFV